MGLVKVKQAGNGKSRRPAQSSELAKGLGLRGALSSEPSHGNTQFQAFKIDFRTA